MLYSRLACARLETARLPKPLGVEPPGACQVQARVPAVKRAMLLFFTILERGKGTNPPKSSRGICVHICTMYYFSLKDSIGFTHSIDNMVLNYYLKCSIAFAIKSLQTSGSARKSYWEKLNCFGCPKWSFYQNHIHYDDGIYLKIGHYTDYDFKKKTFHLLPMLCLEVNPNKHYKKDSFREILKFIAEYCTSGYMIRYDYAIDIPLSPDKVQVFKTRKETGKYKNTRFFGQRNQHGYCRIYDKAKEQNLDGDLTRVEHVCVAGKNPSFEEFCYRDSDSRLDLSGLTPTNKALVLLALQVKACGGDFSEALKTLDRRTRYKIEPYLTGGYKVYKYNPAILKLLLEEMKNLFHVEEAEEKKNEGYVDSDGFLQYDGELPFE